MVAPTIIKDCLNSRFESKKFDRLVLELLKAEYESLEKRYSNVQIAWPFQDSIEQYSLEYCYTDVEKRRLAVLTVELKESKNIEQSRTRQRGFIAHFLKQSHDGKTFDAALVAFYAKNQDEWRLSYVKLENELVVREEKLTTETKITPAKRFSFLAGPKEGTHTAQNQLLPLIKNESVRLILTELERAFNIETVTDDFFLRYKELFLSLTESIGVLRSNDVVLDTHFTSLHISSSDFAKKTLGQLVFLYFLQKKWWFGVGQNSEWGTGPKDFLRRLFQRYSNSEFPSANNFFDDLLEPLFYEALSVDRTHVNQRYARLWEYKIPYLNGGLFDPIARYDWIGTHIRIPDTLFANAFKTKEWDIGNGILDVFDRYNFTVHEEEPLEKEVAIDPEMLGKIFENLLDIKDRKSKGAFYTPKAIVHYMCQESLIEYLITSTSRKEEWIREIIERKNFRYDSEIDADYEKLSIEWKEKVRNAILEIDQKLAVVKIFDPAIWSGAFPMGLLHEIVTIRRYFRDHGWIDFDPPGTGINEVNYLYELKRCTIENSLYGSDIDPGAISTAKLRYWLSLLIDATEPQPLPNFEFKFVAANSLIPLQLQEAKFNTSLLNGVQKKRALQSQITGNLTSQNSLIEAFSEKRRDYFNAHNHEKAILQKELKDLQTQFRGLLFQSKLEWAVDDEYIREGLKFANWDIFGNDSAEFFDMNYMFGVEDGFDIVIGNPPYFGLQKLKGDPIQQAYKDAGYTVHDANGDIYCLFYELGMNLLKVGWVLAYITSNKWMRAGYGGKLRGYFTTHTPLRLIDCGPGIFATATVDTNILLLRNNTPLDSVHQLRAVSLTRDDSGNIAGALSERWVTLSSLTEDVWSIGSDVELLLKAKIERVGRPLKEWDIKINYGIKTGLNEAFIIDQVTRDRLIAEDARSTEILKPILRGRDIKRYGYEWKGLWVIATFPTKKIDIDIYPAIKKYLLDNFDIRQLEQTGIKYSELNFNARKKNGNKWFETQDNIGYWAEFEKEKIVYSEIVRAPQFYVDRYWEYYAEASSFILTWMNLKYICSILNSWPWAYFFRKFYAWGGLGEGWYRYKKAFLINLPIPEYNSALKVIKQLESLATQILDAKKLNPTANTKALEDQIDQLVYELYELTEEEIAIIEK